MSKVTQEVVEPGFKLRKSDYSGDISQGGAWVLLHLGKCLHYRQRGQLMDSGWHPVGKGRLLPLQPHSAALWSPRDIPPIA